MTRRDLLRAAQRRFAVLGYDRTTTRDVADDAGVNLALINRYFGGKQGLFQAVIAAAPDLLAEPQATSGDIVTDFLDGLRPDAWPDFGSHPFLLLLRDSSADSQIRALRSLAMTSSATRILENHTTPPLPRPGSKRRHEAELRAQLVLALFSGIVALRSMAPTEPLASAEVDELRRPIQDAINALLATPPTRGRS